MDHYADAREWTQLHGSWTIWSMLGNITLATLYLLINIGVWNNWYILYTTCCFITGFALSVLDGVVSYTQWDVSNGYMVCSCT